MARSFFMVAKHFQTFQILEKAVHRKTVVFVLILTIHSSYLPDLFNIALFQSRSSLCFSPYSHYCGVLLQKTSQAPVSQQHNSCNSNLASQRANGSRVSTQCCAVARPVGKSASHRVSLVHSFKIIDLIRS
jgi:hypothetical protein